MTYSPVTNTERDSAPGGALLHWPSDVAITFPGIPAATCAVRKVVADALGDSPRRDDLVLVACEYATNAIRHSPSGLPGGVFTMRMWVRPGWVRLEVTDSGTGDWVAGPADLDGESGRGLLVVAGLADSCGHYGRCAWAEVSWR